MFLDYSAVKQCTIECYVSVDEAEWEIKAGTRAQTAVRLPVVLAM